MPSQWEKWSEVANSMDLDCILCSFITSDQDDDWNDEFLNVNWLDQYRDFVESEECTK